MLTGVGEPALVAEMIMVSPAVTLPLIATSVEPLLFTPNVTVSVAPLLVLAVYVALFNDH